VPSQTFPELLSKLTFLLLWQWNWRFITLDRVFRQPAAKVGDMNSDCALFTIWQ
jgi:hypothetical protein